MVSLQRPELQSLLAAPTVFQFANTTIVVFVDVPG